MKTKQNYEPSSPWGVNIKVIPNPLHLVATIDIAEDGNVLTLVMVTTVAYNCTYC